MTVAPTGYLKSHPAAKQEAQLKNVEQSADIINILKKLGNFKTTIQYVRYGRRFIFWKISDIESCNVIVRHFL